jgi:predicted ATPase
MRAQTMIAMHGYAAPQTREALLRARALIRDRVDGIEGLAILYGSWAASYVGGDSKEQKLAASELLAEAERQGDSGALCMAHRAMGTTLLNSGDFDASLRHLSQAQELYDPDQHSTLRHKYGQDIGVAALCYLSWALWHLGNHERAEAIACEAVRRANALSHPHSIVYATAHARGFMDIFSHRADNLQSCADLIIKLSTEQNFSHWINCGRILHGWAAVCRDDFDKGLDELLSGIAGWRGTGSRLWLPMFWTLAAEAFAKSGHVQSAAQAIDQALIASRETGETWALAEILRVKAQIYGVLGNTVDNDVEDLLKTSLQVARRQGARSFELRVACDLGIYCEKQTRPIESLSLARRTPNKFTVRSE